MLKGRSVLLIFVCSIVIVESCSAAPDVKLSKTTGANQTECPTTVNELAQQADICGKPLMDILQGKPQIWPQTESDMMELCKNFTAGEKCIRNLAKKCTKDLQQTILLSVANSMERLLNSECAKPKLQSYLKLYRCLEKNSGALRGLTANVTDHLYVVADQMKETSKKTTGFCCMLGEVEKQVNQTFGHICPEEIKLETELYRGITEEVVELLCNKPKCNDIFNGYTITKRDNPNDGLIKVLMMIFFSLN